MKFNQLETGTRQQTLFSVALLHAPKFRNSRAETTKGKRVYNRELRKVKRAVKRYKINLSKPLPPRFRI